MNLEALKNVCLALYENYEKIEFLIFLENLKGKKNKALMETVEKGFNAIFEAEDDEEETEVEEGGETRLARTVPPEIQAYKTYADQIRKGTVAKFMENPKEETKKMMGIIKNGEGRLKVAKARESFRDFDAITDYEYIPGEKSTPEDVENAKSLLISTVLPHIVYQGVQIARTEKYREAGHDFIAYAIGGHTWETKGTGETKVKTAPVTERLDNFINAYNPEKGGSFLSWEKTNLRNLSKEMRAEAAGISVAGKVWNREKEYNEGDVVNHGTNNYKAIRDVPAGIEPVMDKYGKGGGYWEPLGKKMQEVGFDAPVTNRGEDDEEVSVGETIASEDNTAEETEAKATLKKMMEKMPNDPKYDKIKTMLDMLSKGDTLEEIGQHMGISRERVRQLRDQTFAQLRGEKSFN